MSKETAKFLSDLLEREEAAVRDLRIYLIDRDHLSELQRGSLALIQTQLEILCEGLQNAIAEHQ